MVDITLDENIAGTLGPAAAGGPPPVIAYHGTSTTAAGEIAASGFEQSKNRYDWLGDGAYFFQESPTRALEWATERFGADAAVVEVKVRLDGFVDLLDTRWAAALNQAHDGYIDLCKLIDHAIPQQTEGAHSLDREVINFLVRLLERQGYKVAGIRAAFQEGRAVFPKSALFTHSHVQLCVRDHSAIVDVKVISEQEMQEWQKNSPPLQLSVLSKLSELLTRPNENK